MAPLLSSLLVSSSSHSGLWNITQVHGYISMLERIRMKLIIPESELQRYQMWYSTNSLTEQDRGMTERHITAGRHYNIMYRTLHIFLASSPPFLNSKSNEPPKPLMLMVPPYLRFRRRRRLPFCGGHLRRSLLCLILTTFKAAFDPIPLTPTVSHGLIL